VGKPCGLKQYATDDKSDRDQDDATKDNFEKLRKCVEKRLNSGQTWDDIFAMIDLDYVPTAANILQMNTTSSRTATDYASANQSPWVQSTGLFASSVQSNSPDLFSFQDTSYNSNAVQPDQSTFFSPEFTSSNMTSQYAIPHNPSPFPTIGNYEVSNSINQYPSNLSPTPSLIYPQNSNYPGLATNSSNGNGSTEMYPTYTG
jgi:hypothetical protein